MKKPKNPEHTTRDVNSAQRVSLAITLRAQGYNWEEVAQKAGFSHKGAAHNAVQRELGRTITSNVEELRREEAAILTHLHKRCMQSVDDPNNKGYLFAVDRVLAIRERWAKLFGLDKQADNAAIGNMVVVRELPPSYLGITQESQP
jgi:hypothetical protein